MGIQFSREIKYKMVNINGNNVSIPYIRLATGQWVPFQQQNYYVQPQQQQQQQQQHWNAQRTLPLDTFVNPNHINQGHHVNPTLISSRTVYPVTNLEYHMPSQTYYNSGFFR